MATKKKMLQAAAGNAGGAGLNVEEVFSTYLYESDGTTQTITNNIDLSGEGGMVWIKRRNGSSSNNRLHDTERGMTSGTGGSPYLWTNATTGSQGASYPGSVVASSTGFDITSTGINDLSDNGGTYASWTFRKAPKFFDVVTFTGSATTVTVPHNLGIEPGAVFVKNTSTTSNWFVSHRFSPSNGWADGYYLNTDGSARINDGRVSNVTDSSIDVYTGNDSQTYVAYIFAHNDGDGEFGPDGDADIIKCGSYTGNSTVGQEIDLGFEPQFVMAKIASTTGNWYIQDAMRTMTGNGSPTLQPNSSGAEYNSNGYTEGNIELTSTGFKLDTNDHGGGNGNGATYIYIAIRRGTKVPESGTEVFDVDLVPGSSGPTYTSSFPVDMATMFRRSGGDDWYTSDRLRGPKIVKFNTTGIESGFGSFASFDYSAGFSRWDDTAYSAWMWKRAPGFFDAVAYTGLGAYGSINHNLTVEPEMVWFKNREDAAEWICWHKDFPSGNHLRLNEGSSFYTGVLPNSFSVSDTQINFRNTNAYQVNSTSWNYIAYLFASLPGVSKVGTYAGNGGSQTIDCGFTSGARFVLIKRSSGNGSWYIFDTRRGIVSGNDPYLQLNTQSSEDTFGAKDIVDPHSSGFIVNQTTIDTNVSGEDYIFYAIA